MSKNIEIDDDTFDYDGGMSQCVSGFGRDTSKRIYEDMQNVRHFSNEELNEAKEHIQWSIGELVRWVRNFNGKSKRLASESAAKDEATMDVLKDVEWQATSIAGIPLCPSCFGVKPGISVHPAMKEISGHKPSCKLAAQIKLLESLISNPKGESK